MTLFVGRERELRLLLDRMQQADDSSGGVVFLSGDAGLGKTRLVDEVTRIAEESESFLAVKGGCNEEDDGIQYRPVSEALRHYLRLMSDDDLRAVRGLLREIVKLVPDLTCRLPELTPSEALPPGQERVRLFESLVQLGRRVSSDRTLLLILEDIHWADESTLKLIHYLCEELRGERVLFLLTYRPQEAASNDPLSRLIRDLAAHDGAPVLALRPFTWVETRSFVRQRLELDGPPPTLLLDTLYERAEGNPFFTDELLRSFDLEAHELTLDAFPRRLESLPSSLAEVLQRRINLLKPKSKHALKHAAVVGRSFSLDILAGVLGHDPATVLRSLREPVAKGLIIDRGADKPDLFEFRHALIREAAAALLLPSERRRLHLAVAHCIERIWGARHPERAVALAYHYDLAADAAQTVRWGAEAAEMLRRSGAPAEALIWYRRALSASRAIADSEPIALLEKAAVAATEARSFGEAADWLGEVALAHEKAQRIPELGEVLSRQGRLCWLAGDPARAGDVFRRAQALLEGEAESPALARTLAGMSNLFLTAFKGFEAYKLAEAARAMARHTKADDVLPQAHRIMGSILAAMRAPERGIALLEEAVRGAIQQDDEVEVVSAYGNLVSACVKSASWAKAEQVAKEGMKYVRDRGGRNDAWITSKLVEVYRLTGRWADAEALANENDVVLDERNGQDYIISAVGRCLLLADLGRWEEVEQRLDDLLPPAARSGEFQSHGIALLVPSRLALSKGDLDTGVAHARRALSLLRGTTDTFHGLPLLLHACDLFTRVGDEAAAERCVQQLRATYDFSQSKTALAHLETADAILRSARGERDESIAHSRRASGLWRDLARPYDLGRSLVRLGSALLTRGCPVDRNEAKVLLDEARCIFGRLGAPDSAEVEELLRRSRLVSSRRRSDGLLSNREREIAALVAQGLTNREMAQVLFISPKTTEHHLSRILGKLGFTSRSQLAAYVVQHKLVMADS